MLRVSRKINSYTIVCESFARLYCDAVAVTNSKRQSPTNMPIKLKDGLGRVAIVVLITAKMAALLKPAMRPAINARMAVVLE